MIILVSASPSWAIGYNNRLLYWIPEDMRRFKSLTTGNVVVMGRKTFESLPGGKPLPDRVNIIATRNTEMKAPGVRTAAGTKELLEILREYEGKEIYLIGGGAVIREFLPLCEKAYITKVSKEMKADTYMPDLDADPEWEIVSSEPEAEYEDLRYSFVTYRRTSETE